MFFGENLRLSRSGLSLLTQALSLRRTPGVYVQARRAHSLFQRIVFFVWWCTATLKARLRLCCHRTGEKEGVGLVQICLEGTEALAFALVDLARKESDKGVSCVWVKGSCFSGTKTLTNSSHLGESESAEGEAPLSWSKPFGAEGIS